MPIREIHLDTSTMRVVALAGGVGGAKLADGLAQVLPPEHLTVIVNVGDDFEHLGLKICPDLDTVCYTLAGLANPETGWGRIDETWHMLESLGGLGGPTWFRLGDRDLALHLERTNRLRLGLPLSQVTRDLCQQMGVQARVLPVTDDSVPTMVVTESAELPFQEYFVRQHCEPVVTGFRFVGVEQARPASGVLEALRQADLVVLCPSNPWVSLDPVLAIPGVTTAIGTHRVVGVSPIIGGQTVKGPAAKMFAELGIRASALAVAQHYSSLLSGFLLDDQDSGQADAVQGLDILPYVTHTIMHTQSDRRRLALEVLEFSKML
ncbi:MAG: 2-phospho-L-lactate transferase [Anaerolineales bacterium]|nr:2-phospho-L-lactate transferase [Anaerolineales bacterium]